MEPVFAKHPELIPVMERLVEPERMLQFRVAWVDDKGTQQVRSSLPSFSVRLVSVRKQFESMRCVFRVSPDALLLHKMHS